MHHPLTGGGMTVALYDFVLLAPMPDLADRHAVAEVLLARKPLAASSASPLWCRRRYVVILFARFWCH
jgi:hypothetical protein